MAGIYESASILNTPLGWMVVVATPRGIRRLAFADQQSKLVEILETFHPECTIVDSDPLQTFADFLDGHNRLARELVRSRTKH